MKYRTQMCSMSMSPCKVFLASVLFCEAVHGFRWREVQSHKFLHNVANNATSGRMGHELWHHHGDHPVSTDPHPCDTAIKVTMHSDKFMKCPESCPLYVENRGNGVHCDFRCVEATHEACKAHDPETPIVDLKMGACRSCMVLGCDKCASDGTEACMHCSSGFSLTAEGQCTNNASYVWSAIFSVLAIILFIVIWWIVDLARRDVTNPGGLQKGLELRSLAKLRQPAGPDGHGDRQVWDMDTNLCTTMVAGPGIILDFNFQVAVILWAFAVAAAWSLMAACVDTDLFVLGTRKGESAREMCIVVEWGFDTQQRLMPSKVAFVFALYVSTCILAFLHSVRQLHNFQGMDEATITHKDFVATITGMPQIQGKEKVEEQLQEAIQKASGQTTVCASVGWVFAEADELVMRTVHEDLTALASPPNTPRSPRDPDVKGPGLDRQSSMSPRSSIPEGDEAEGMASAKVGGTPRRESRPPQPTAGLVESFESPDVPALKESPSSEDMWGKLGPMAWVFHKMEFIFINPTTQKFITKGRQKNTRLPKSRLSKDKRKELDDQQGDILGFLEGATTCDQAFVVFESEASRDRAVEACKDGVAFKDATLHLRVAEYEPDSIVWKNFTNIDRRHMIIRLLIGIGVIFLATIVWTVVFYLPYAWFVSASNYKYGQEPGAVAGTTFGLIVCLGNALMYLVCAEVADRVQFRFAGQRELCYMLLYAFACMFNVLLDLIFTYYIAFWMMSGSGMRTVDGTLIADLTSFRERFESYAMQRELGNLLWAYACPATFLIPFLVEPIATIYAPYKLMSFIVRSHPEIGQTDSEELLQSIPMDLSRYSDIWLNIMLAVLVFFFPGGLVVTMYLMMGVSHLWIYLFDHFRVLRSIPKCYYSSMQVDWWGTWMLGIPIGLLLTCALFKCNCMNEGPFCLPGDQIVTSCFQAFFLHMTAYTLVLMYVIPLCVREKYVPADDAETFKMCAQRLAPSYMNTNPMYCLRSEYVYEHDPPCDFCLAGKEHYMRLHPEIGQFFCDTKAVTEDFSRDFVSFADAKKEMAILAHDAQKHAKDAAESVKGAASAVKDSGKRLGRTMTRTFTKDTKKEGDVEGDVTAEASAASAAPTTTDTKDTKTT